MANNFRDFVEAELKEILDSMDEECRNDPQLCRQVALEWIEKNAKLFRMRWNMRSADQKCNQTSVFEG